MLHSITRRRSRKVFALFFFLCLISCNTSHESLLQSNASNQESSRGNEQQLLQQRQLQPVVKCPTCGSGELNCDNVNQCTASCGQVKSVNYPYNYGNNHRCRWSIRAPESYYVNLSIIDFDIPSANNASKLGTCIFDYLTLIDGYTGKRLGCYCNENLPPVNIVSPWNELIIQFDTNSETTGRGFYFQYEFKKLELDERIKKQLKPPSEEAIESVGVVGDDSLGGSGNSTYCLNGWQYFRGSCYKAFNELEPLQWYDAESKCNIHGKGLDGHLVSILDRDEMLVIHYFLTNIWKSARYRVYYIGLIDVTREGVYRWSDNNPMSYTDWELKPMLLEEEMPAQPDGGAYEDCTIIRYNSFSRISNWHDVPCSLGKHYHSYSEKGVHLSYKWDYVNGYICKSDSTSRSKVRRPLFSNEFIPSIQGSHLISHLAGSGTTTSNGSPIKTIQSTLTYIHNQTGSTSNDTISLDYIGQRNRAYLASILDDNRYFVCDNLEVISVVLRCDGIAHCRDGSDESYGCDQDCLEWQFKCGNGRCISIGSYCNFVDDCGDGSDESRCERHRCKIRDEFKCNSGQCIMASQKCDLVPDCSDSSDEGRLCTIGSNCNSASTFQCYNGNCIPQYAVCDFQIDCPGKFHEDEDNATCDLVLKNRSSNYKLSSANLNTTPPTPSYQQTSLVAYYQVSNTNQRGQEVSANDLARHNLFRCTSGNIIDSSLKCLFEFDRYGFQIGCRDVSHLTECAAFECPKDYVKCSNSYCIPWRYICDGKWDCILGDDEVGCARYVCPGQYKCANQSSCILLHQICDSHRQCPMGDDEWFCDLQCPTGCDCIGQSVTCRGANLSSLPSNFIARSVRKLDLSYNRLGPDLSNSNFTNYHDLGELILHHNGIEVLIPRKFHQLRNLYKLDLSNNQIHSVKRGAFAGLRRVTQLLLESNPELDVLEPEAFLGLSSLQMLNISSSRIIALKKNTFDGLLSLRHLLLRSNMIMDIEDGAFRTLTSLVSLDMRGNEIRHFTKSVFSDLKSLRNLSTDSFKFCCLMNHQIPADRCLPLPDEISDCEDLLSSVPQRTCIWIAGIVACAGNVIVIVFRFINRKEREQDLVNSTLLLSLGCSDLLMGIYLIIIAIADSWYRGRYIEKADDWRESWWCNVCGVLSTVSSEVSVFTLVSIALNRMTEICRPFSSAYKFTLDYTHRLILGSWCVALLIALAPLVIKPYFNGQFYARSGVCLAFHITNQKAAGWMYSIFVFLCVNLVAFIVIVYCYTRMYIELSRMAKQSDVERYNNPKSNPPIQIALIVITSFVAWSPTIILGFIAIAGIALPAAVYSWIAVLVLPVNSAINPMIYTIPNIRHQISSIIRTYRARKSGGANHHHLHRPHHQATNGQTKGLLLENVELRKKLAQRNVPPGYVPLKDYILQSQEVSADHLLAIAIGIARDIEKKHAESRVYVILGLENVCVTDRIITNCNQENSLLSSNCRAGVTLKSNLPLQVFVSDSGGYMKKKSHCSSNCRNPQYHQHHRSHQRDSVCQCRDLHNFGDIVLSLIKLYNNKRKKDLEEQKQQQLKMLDQQDPLQQHLLVGVYVSKNPSTNETRM